MARFGIAVGESHVALGVGEEVQVSLWLNRSAQLDSRRVIDAEGSLGFGGSGSPNHTDCLRIQGGVSLHATESYK